MSRCPGKWHISRNNYISLKARNLYGIPVIYIEIGIGTGRKNTFMEGNRKI